MRARVCVCVCVRACVRGGGWCGRAAAGPVRVTPSEPRSTAVRWCSTCSTAGKGISLWQNGSRSARKGSVAAPRATVRRLGTPGPGPVARRSGPRRCCSGCRCRYSCRRIDCVQPCDAVRHSETTRHGRHGERWWPPWGWRAGRLQPALRLERERVSAIVALPIMMIIDSAPLPKR